MGKLQARTHDVFHAGITDKRQLILATKVHAGTPFNGRPRRTYRLSRKGRQCARLYKKLLEF